VAADLRRTEQALLEGLRRARLADGASTAAPDRRQSIATLQAALQPADALLAHGIQGDELFVGIVRRDGVQLRRRLAPWPTVLQAVQAFRFQVDALRHGSAPVARHLAMLTQRAQARLDQLQQLLWAPLADALSGVTRLLVVPSGLLGGVPMAPPADARLQLSVLPSLQMARPLPAAPGGPGGVVVMGESTRLPHAAAEARRIAACHPGARLSLDEAATLANLQRLAPDAGLLHLACHAQFRGDSPRFSALHLHDGAATAEWLEGLALPAGATVVLSACETGLSDAGDGDEMVGLVRAFLVAGAARVVASLWPVDDAITATFMARFHQRLAEGLPCALALADARAALRAAHPHPAHWAGFQQFGNW
jgi:CHAT domain-containing protein